MQRFTLPDKSVQVQYNSCTCNLLPSFTHNIVQKVCMSCQLQRRPQAYSMYTNNNYYNMFDRYKIGGRPTDSIFKLEN